MATTEAGQATNGAGPVRIITETRNLRTQPFAPGDDQLTSAKAWDE